MIMKRFSLPLLLTALLLETGCGAKKTEITELQRKEAELLVSDAQFAMRLRKWAEAETSLAQAAEKVPDTGIYWLALGEVRMRLGKRAEAKSAYESALKAFAAEAKQDATDHEPWLGQVHTLALLGRADDSRALLDKAAKQFPASPEVKAFVEGKRLDALLADPNFKEVAL